MKLALPLLLVTLALCCFDANAGEVCPALSSVMKNFLLGTKADFKEKINQFDAPEEAMQGTLQVKACVNKLPMFDRLTVAHFVSIVNFFCKNQSS